MALTSKVQGEQGGGGEGLQEVWDDVGLAEVRLDGWDVDRRLGSDQGKERGGQGE